MVAASASAWARARARARSLAFSGRSAVCSSRRLLMMSWRRRIGRARDCAGGSRGGTGRPSRQGPGPARRQPPTPGALPRSPSYGGCPEGRGPWSPYPHRLRRCFGCGAASGVAPRAPTAPSQLSDGRPAREPISGTCPSSWSERTRSTLARTPDGRARGAVRCSAVPGLPPCRPVRAGDTRGPTGGVAALRSRRARLAVRSGDLAGRQVCPLHAGRACRTRLGPLGSPRIVDRVDGGEPCGSRSPGRPVCCPSMTGMGPT